MSDLSVRSQSMTIALSTLSSLQPLPSLSPGSYPAGSPSLGPSLLGSPPLGSPPHPSSLLSLPLLPTPQHLAFGGGFPGFGGFVGNGLLPASVCSVGQSFRSGFIPSPMASSMMMVSRERRACKTSNERRKERRAMIMKNQVSKKNGTGHKSGDQLSIAQNLVHEADDLKSLQRFTQILVEDDLKEVQGVFATGQTVVAESAESVELLPEEALVPLSQEEEIAVESALVPNPEEEVLVEKFSILIRRKDIVTLAPGVWLNDQIINFYLNMIVERSGSEDGRYLSAFTHQTFFFSTLASKGYSSVRRWTKRVDIFSKDLLLIPVHLQVHWTAVVVNLKGKVVEFCDSMGSKRWDILDMVLNYLRDEMKDKKNKELDMSEWKRVIPDVPQQQNRFDCGMFACKFLEYRSRQAAINFTQAEMPHFRRRMIWEILNKTFYCPS